MGTKIKELVTFEENPFLDGLSGDRRKKTEVLYADGKVVLDPKTGEVEDALAVARVKYVESEQFVKLYLGQLGVFFDLSKPAQRVAEFVFEQIGRRAMGRGEVMLAHSEYEKHFRGRSGTSRTTFMRGLQELADKNVIAKSTIPNFWWINPAMAFNGDRARFVTEIRRKKRESKTEAIEREGQQRLGFDGEEEAETG